jgi:hypothetical protein
MRERERHRRGPGGCNADDGGAERRSGRVHLVEDREHRRPLRIFEQS